MLKVWLPLNGDLRNQGISNLNTIIMPTCATIDNTGKIGKCYTSDGSAAGVSTNFNFQASEFSIAAWVRINTRVNAWRCPIKLIHSTEKDYIGFCCEHNTQASYIGFHFYKTIDNTNTPIFDTYPITDMPIGEWVHLTVTYNGKTAIYYKNGIKINSSNIAAAKQNAIANIDRIIMLGSDGGRSGAAVKSSLNDVRIYDHCLSAAEVKEIAQGLVLHYKLDGETFGNSNLLTNTEKLDANVTKPSGVNITAEGYQNFTTATYDNTSGSSYHELLYWNGKVTVAANEIYTASFYAKSPISATLTTYFYNNTSGIVQNQLAKSSIGTTSTNADGGINITLTPNWQRYWITWTFNSVTTSATKTLLFRILKGQGEVSICGIKLEKGNAATPWCPADSEMNIDRTIIEDSSGYGHHLTSNSVLSVDTNTPRYSAATLFDGTQVATGTTPGADIRTISCWVKTTKNKSTSQIFVGDSASNMCVSFYSGTIIGVFGTTRSTGSKCTLGDSYKENDWNHIVVVKTSDDGQRDIWCNGVQLTPAANDYWSAATGLWLGARNASVGNPLYGALSDVRFYVTPLLDTDIKQLYNVGMKVDKNHNIHVYEFQEQNINLFSSIPWTAYYSTHSTTTNLFTNYNSKNEPQFVANSTSAGSNFIEITPGIYEYDYTISVNAGNQFYIGFERYDANKTSRSNAACVYTYATKPSSDIVKQRYKGTVDLSTDGVNTIKYIALRILNGWSGTTSGVTGQATIHNFSLRLQSAATNPQLTKTGQLIGDEFKEYSNAKFYKDHIIEANHFIER